MFRPQGGRLHRLPMAAVRSWEDLPHPLLDLVLERLPVPDYHRFAAVCTSWCDAQRDHRRRRRPHGSQMPWLMTLKNHPYHPPHQPRFYSPSEKRYYRLPVPDKQLHGVSHGRFLFTDETRRSLFIVNPFAPAGTESEIEIPLPTDPFFPDMFLLSSAPTDPDCVVMLWMGDDHYVCRLNSTTGISWVTVPGTMIQNLQASYPPIHDGKLYMASHDYARDDGPRCDKLIIVELFPVPVATTFEMEIVGMSMPIPDYRDHYLLESDGQIWLVWLFFEDNEEGINPWITNGFHVFRADLSRKLWVRLESLGDRVIFLGLDGISTHPFSLPAAETGGPGNHIYCIEESSRILIEFNYESRQLMRSKLPQSTDDGITDEGEMSWLVPNLW